MTGGGDPISYNEAHFDQQGNKKATKKKGKAYLFSFQTQHITEHRT
jgi:hypothetical protein